MAPSTVGQRARALRVIRRLTQVEAARRLGIDQTTLSRIETDVLLPTEELADRMRALYAWTPAVDAAIETILQAAPPLGNDDTEEDA